MEEGETQPAVWNFDGSELYLIFQIKSKIVEALNNWDIIEAYKKIRLLRMELDAILVRDKKKILEDFDAELEESKKKPSKDKKKIEKEEIDDLMEDLDNVYSEYIQIGNPTDKEKSSAYQAVEFVYMTLCYTMKKHSLYFREGEDFRLAVLRR